MKHFLIDLLPDEVRTRVRSRGERRRTQLLVLLMMLSLLGVCVHSWDQLRRADAVRQVAYSFRDNLDDVDTVIARLEQERDRLAAYMAAYRSVANPIPLSGVAATIINALPPRSTLTDVAFKVVTREMPRPNAGAAGVVGAAATPAPTPPAVFRRFLEIRLRGYAAGSAEVTQLERTLGGTAPLQRVTLLENRSLETPDGNFQEFVISAEIPFDRSYLTETASGPLASAGPEAKP